MLDARAGILTAFRVDDLDPSQPIALEGSAEDVEVAVGSVWVASGGDLIEVDPLTRTVVGRIPTGAPNILEFDVDPETGLAWIDVGSA